MSKIAFHLNCLAQGGAERVVSSLANELAAEGEQVYIATEWQDENEFAIDERITRVHVGLRASDEHKGRFSKYLLRVKYLKEFLKAEQPDVLISFARKANYRAIMASKGTGVPVIISIRNNPVEGYASFIDRLQVKSLFPHAAGCVFQTKDQKAFFYPLLQDNSRIILNPINPKYLSTTSVDESEKEKSIVHHARIVDFKNQPMLLRAFLRVHASHPDYILRIYGDDSGDGTLEILEKIIHDNHAEGSIFLMGPSDSLEKELPKGMVYAFTSDCEGLPNSLLEAMALGLPCVATDCPCGGPATVIEHMKNGYLIPIKDEDALVKGLNTLIENRDLALSLGKEAAKISEIANAECIANQWKDYINEIITKGHRG